MDSDDAPTSSKLSALLEGTDAEVDKRWSELSEQALDDEIAAYRGGIEDVSKDLESLGVIVSLEDRNDGGGAGIAGMEVLFLVHADPCRWQVKGLQLYWL